MDDILRMLDARASEIEEIFTDTEADSIAALRSALSHLSWALTAKPIPKQRRHITAAIYSSRVIQHAYGFYRLTRLGNAASAEIVSRAALEAAFVVGALAKDANFSDEKDFFKCLTYKSKSAQKKALEGFLETARQLSSQERERIGEQISKLRTELVELEPHRMSKTIAIARAAGMEDFYAREYAHQSRAVHSDLEALANEHVANVQGELTLRGPSFTLNDAKFQIACLIAAVMETATSMAQLLNLEIHDAETKRIEDASAFCCAAFNATDL